MEKENVLEIKIVKVNDKESAWYISYQNEEVLKRGKFKDDELKVYSDTSPAFCYNVLFLRGERKFLDYSVRIIPNENVEKLKEKVQKINEEYGIPKRWRVEESEIYFYIGEGGKVKYTYDFFCEDDDGNYEIGNYFKTEEEAQKVKDSKEWKDFWAKVRAGVIGND